MRALPCAVMILLVVSSGCDRSSSGPTGPSAPGTRTGVWTGTLTTPGNVDAVRLVLDEQRLDNDRSLLGGTWTVTGAAGATSTGVLIGTLSGATGTLTLTPSAVPTCATAPVLPGAVGTYIVTTLSVATDNLRGPYQLGTCQGSVAGTLDVRR